MIQAARSGKQNIPEGYLQKSLKGKIKLLGVSRGSLEELLNDYLDFLRQRNLALWEKDVKDNPKNSEAWLNVYTAARMIKISGGTKTQKDLDAIVSDSG